MDIKRKYWDKKLAEYAKQDWINKPSIFAEWSINFFPKKGKILELGAGRGQDTKFFKSRGYSVISTDFSETGLSAIQESLLSTHDPNITVLKLDLKETFPFVKNSFDIVYAHMSVHFFDSKTTQQIFSEIYRVLKPGGIIAILVNSKDDPEYGIGPKLENDFFRTRVNIDKRFFDTKSMAKFGKKLKTFILDNKGETYKDGKWGIANLIRFIGRKPQKNG